MKIVLSSAVLASVLAPAFSFSYLDTLGGAAAPAAYSPPAAAAPSNGASYLDALTAPVPVAPAPVAPEPVFEAAPAAEPYVPAATAPVAPAASYHESLSTGASIRGPGLMTHVDSLNTGVASLGGPGLHSYTASLPSTSAVAGGSGLGTYTDALSPSTGEAASYNPFGSAAAPAAFAGEASADGVSFTLETGDISGLVQDLQAGGTLRLTGSIDSISYN
mmetsp:Transcript_34513/g.81358  ORF Transcript_34513/g.81358 Transcript_34513/m.81358 type:complete len:219 (+) Transcript_34513:105-761(+)